MALIRSLDKRSMERNSVHEAIRASYTTFEVDGLKYIQIDTFGSEHRKVPGKLSQTLQLDRQGAMALFDILRKEFDL